MNQTECQKFFCTSQFSALGNDLRDATQESFELEIYEIWPFDEWVTKYSGPYEYCKTFDEARNDPIITVHSSGSTGDPKPITNTNGWFAGVEHPLPDVEGRELGGISLLDFEGGGGYYSPFPGFHIAGITALAFYPVMWKYVPPLTAMDLRILLENPPELL